MGRFHVDNDFACSLIRSCMIAETLDSIRYNIITHFASELTDYIFLIHVSVVIPIFTLFYSPIGEIFRARLRQFPALVNCCTIDWFSPWPDTALQVPYIFRFWIETKISILFQSVAQQFLRDVEDFNVSENILQGIVIVFQFMHASVVEASVRYEQELSRHNYVTPTSYLELLSSYTELINKKKGSLTEGVGRLSTGKIYKV